MILAIGIDVHKNTSSAYAVYAGRGQENEKHRKFLNSFNNEFTKFPSTAENMKDMVTFVRGHECHILLENSTKAHEIYWVLRNTGMNVIVAQAQDLYHITRSDRKTDRNDSIELAGYMRRRLMGEDREFADCYVPSPEWMMKREMCRGVFAEKEYLGNTKRRIRSHLLLHGIKLTREYDDITSLRPLAEMRYSKDPYLIMQANFADDAKKRILFGERTIEQMFSGNKTYDLIFSIVGIGKITAAYLTSLIVDIKRFPTSSNFTASFGVVPRRRDSGERSPNLGTTHRGDDIARDMLMYCARSHIRHVENSVVTKMYHRLVNNGKPKREALIAAVRKLLTVVWSVLKSGVPYTTDLERLMMARKDSEDTEQSIE
jgi:transposase